MNSPTAELKAEHQGVMRVLAVLERMCDHLSHDEMVATDHLAQVLEFLRVFVDQCHHGKEEDFLFPALEQGGMPHDSGPIAVMLAEHAHGRQLVQLLGQALEGLSQAQPQPGADEDLSAAGRQYIELLRAHIHKEESVLFSIAEVRLDQAQQERMSRDFERLEQERIGPGRHEAFHRMIQQLSHIYLG
jgi:hemerythrin-like domain-containing protein